MPLTQVDGGDGEGKGYGADERQTFYNQPYFQNFLEKTKVMWVKPRKFS